MDSNFPKFSSREGITAENPLGTSWAQIMKQPGKAKHVSYDLGLLWVVTQDGKIFRYAM